MRFKTIVKSSLPETNPEQNLTYGNHYIVSI